MTGDVDVTSPVQGELEEELRRPGFEKLEGLGHTPSGWVHPALGLGFEVVASTPMDGTVDFQTFSADLAARREAAGNPQMPHTAGNRRTDSKRAMLAKLKELGADW